MTDHSRSRHTHPDDISCEEAGAGGHPPHIVDAHLRRWTSFSRKEFAEALDEQAEADRDFARAIEPLVIEVYATLDRDKAYCFDDDWNPGEVVD